MSAGDVKRVVSDPYPALRLLLEADAAATGEGMLHTHARTCPYTHTDADTQMQTHRHTDADTQC